MPNDNGDMKHRNGALVQHSNKWADENRRKDSHAAGQGSRGSRNQGTGAAGKSNTVASQGTDTSKMNPHEKLKYFNSLGLLNPTQKQQLADMDSQAAPKAPEPTQVKPSTKSTTPSVNPVKELSDRLIKIFAQKPNLIQGIVKSLQAVPKEQMKDTANRILKSMEGTSNEPTEVFSTVMKAIEGDKSDELDLDVVDEPAKPEQRNRTASMTEEEFRQANQYLGDKFVQSMIDQAKQFEDSDKALFMIDMAIENVDDVNDERAVRSSMASAADDLAANGFELKGREEVPDGLDFSDEQDDYISDDNRQWDQLVNFFKADSPAAQDDRSASRNADMIIDKIENRLDGDNLDKMRLAKAALDKAMKEYVPGEKSRYVTATDAVFNAFKQYEAEHGEKVTPDGYLVKKTNESNIYEEVEAMKQLGKSKREINEWILKNR